MLKKLLMITLAIFMSFCCISCGDENTSSSPSLGETREEVSSGFYKDLDAYNKYYITNADGLMTFGAIMNDDVINSPLGYSSRVFRGAQVEIECDIDMTDKAWVPMQVIGVSGLEIDGNGYTISNLRLSSENNIPSGDNETGTNKIGFIGESRSNITIKDLTFDSARVESGLKWISVVCGYHLSGSLRLQNVDVKNSEIIGSLSNEDSKRLGMLVGLTQFYDDSVELYLMNCDVDNCKITGYEAIAGLVGTFYKFTDYSGRWGVSNCSVSNCVFKAGRNEEKYVNTFIVDNHRFEVDDAYFEALGNTHANNTIEVGVSE